MLLTLTAYWYPEGYDEDDYEITGKSPVLTKEEIVISTNHVVAFHPHTECGESMIRLVSGDVFRVTMKYQELKDLMFDDEVNRDILSSGEN